MTDPAPTPLTSEERELMAELLYRDAIEQWEAAESERLAMLATLEPLADCPDIDDVILALGAIIDNEAAEQDIRDRASRVRLVLDVDMRAIKARMAQLAVPIAAPVAAGQ